MWQQERQHKKSEALKALQVIVQQQQGPTDVVHVGRSSSTKGDEPLRQVLLIDQQQHDSTACACACCTCVGSTAHTVGTTRKLPKQAELRATNRQHMYIAKPTSSTHNDTHVPQLICMPDCISTQRHPKTRQLSHLQCKAHKRTAAVAALLNFKPGLTCLQDVFIVDSLFCERVHSEHSRQACSVKWGLTHTTSAAGPQFRDNQ